MRVLPALLSISLLSAVQAHPAAPEARQPETSNQLVPVFGPGPRAPTTTNALALRADDGGDNGGKDNDKDKDKDKDKDDKDDDKDSKSGKAAGILAAFLIVETVWSNFQDLISGNQKARGEFTQTLIKKLSEADSNKNYVLAHTKHEFDWEGVRGTDWVQKHVEFKIIGGTIGYDVYVSQKGGKFTLKGDGGYQNWAYYGFLDNKKTKTDKHQLVFLDAPVTETKAASAAVPSETTNMNLDAGSIVSGIFTGNWGNVESSE